LIQRHLLSKKDRKRLVTKVQDISPKLAEALKKASKIEVIKVKFPNVKVRLFLADEIPLVVEESDKLMYPSLVALFMYEYPFKAFVDQGAVKHILRGADVMVPGITKVEGEFERNKIVGVYSESTSKPLAVCLALMSYKEILEHEKGRALKNLHYLGDKLCKLYKSIK